MGFRIPAVAISPYTRGQRGFRVDHGTYGFESILSLIAYRFGLGSLTTALGGAQLGRRASEQERKKSLEGSRSR
jgi:hypothetical protein